EEVLGIITERDILRAEASNEDPLETLTVEDVMGCCEVICHLEDTLDEAISVMAEHQIRYLPIVQEKKLLGLVSMGDLLRARFSLKEIKSPQLSPHFSLNQSTNPSVPR
ncbi:MAG: CBS domain-containing protein, partial [Pirellulaceae bacterium]|nr:CBS domain-containing protein [Pirellulaceae bacterium]